VAAAAREGGACKHETALLLLLLLLTKRVFYRVWSTSICVNMGGNQAERAAPC